MSERKIRAFICQVKLTWQIALYELIKSSAMSVIGVVGDKNRAGPSGSARGPSQAGRQGVYASKHLGGRNESQDAVRFVLAW